jgi:hypothetical protein
MPSGDFPLLGDGSAYFGHEADFYRVGDTMLPRKLSGVGERADPTLNSALVRYPATMDLFCTQTR